MANRIKKVFHPLYMQAFQCIAERCEDNCCIGWDVEMDKKTYEKYRHLKDKGLADLVERYLYVKEDCYNSKVDYAAVRLLPHNKCPFLNNRGLCRIQATLGEEFLSNVCYTYPRVANEVNGTIEYSVTLSCPEAARLVLGDKKGLIFVEEEEDVAGRRIINHRIDTTLKGNPFMLRYLKEMRSVTIDVLQDRQMSLNQRIWLLFSFYNKLSPLAKCSIHRREESRVDVQMKRLLEGFRKNHRQKETEGKRKEEVVPPISLSNRRKKQCRMMEEIVDYAQQFTSIDIEKYISYTKLSEEGIKKFVRARGREGELSLDAVEYIVENYLVNYVFQELFPAGESTDPLESYCMLVLRYSIIMFYLTGIFIYEGSVKDSLAIDFIQTFSKGVEHHHTYLEYMAEGMLVKNYITKEHLTTMLGVEEQEEEDGRKN